MAGFLSHLAARENDCRVPCGGRRGRKVVEEEREEQDEKEFHIKFYQFLCK